MLEHIDHLIDAGCALHWLHEKSKRPIGDDWSTKPVWTAAQMRAKYRDGNNLGVRLGEPSRIGDLFLQVLDVDVRDPAQSGAAFAKLSEILPGWETFPAVKSGSGGPSLHVYFVTNQPFRSKKLDHSVEKWVDSAGKSHWAFEIELFGTGKQVVLPPSIHPDTGKPYRWLREIDFELIELGAGPFVDASVVATWSPELSAAAPGEEDDDDFAAEVRAAPADVTDAQIKETLSLLPLDEWCEDRDGWFKVGMALHHQFEGGVEGFDLWAAFSKQSPKFDPKDQRRVWDSFRLKTGGVRFPTLLQAAAVERGRRAAEEIDDEDLIGDLPEEIDDEDLIGEAPSPLPDVPWAQLLELTEKGGYKATLHNLELIVRNDIRFKGIVRKNEFTLNECYRGEPGFKAFNRKRPKPTRQLNGPAWKLDDAINGDIWGETRNNHVRSIIEAPRSQGGYGLKVPERDLKAAINLAAAENPYHPIREYLESIPWDGVERLDTLMIRYLGVEDTLYHRAAGRLPLVAAVTRAYEPGHKWDFVPIIEGEQGVRKSSFIAVLGKHWSCELNGDFSDRKALVEKMQGAWVMEIPELAGFSKHEVEEIKAAISAPSDKVRLPWRTDAQDYKRQSIMYGSTNTYDYLRDPTGGRRFWPIRCLVEAIDIDGLSREVDQLWAEALAGYRAMRKKQPFGTLPLYLRGGAAAAEAKGAQEDRRGETSADLWANKIEVWLDRPMLDDSGFTDDDEPERLRNEVTLREVWTQCFGRDESQLNSGIAAQLSAAMKQVSTFENLGPRKKEGRSVRVYRRRSAFLE